ncbi:MAG: thioredoxin family protein, partial [bacterium]
MIPLKDQEIIREKFAHELTGPVKIDLFTDRELALTVPGEQPCPGCKPTREMLQELSSLSDLLSLRVHIWKEAREERESLGIVRVPGIVLRDHGSVAVKFYGIPAGAEFPGFVESIIDISRGEALLPPVTVKSLRKLKDDVTVRVFVTPTCPYCPQMARAAYHLALANPKVHAEVIEITEFPELAERYDVRAVPLTVIADKARIAGVVQPEVLVDQLLTAAQSPAAEAPKAAGPSLLVSPAAEGPPQRGQ